MANKLYFALAFNMSSPSNSSCHGKGVPGWRRQGCECHEWRYNFAPKTGIAFDDINQLKGGGWSRYGQSKLGNILHAKYLRSLFGSEESRKSEGVIWTAAVHPGNIYTDLSKNARFPVSSMIGPILNFLGMFVPAEQGAYNSVFCAASERIHADISGEYFTPIAKVDKPSKLAKDAGLAQKL
jgi:NAD(P)-dependent dehydrogenase (short-subunit alcohol dehydrogenase family)